MPNATYHLLAECEPFSEFYGGAISRWAGNLLRDAASSVVVCPSADNTWKFPPASILLLPGLEFYRRFRGRLSRLPWLFHRLFIRCIFRPLLERVRPGDIVWIHNRPEYAIALTPHIHRVGGRVVLQMHNSHLVESPARLMRQVRVDRLVFVSEFLMEQARKKFPLLGPSSVLYNGADEAVFYPARGRCDNPETPTVLFAGRFVENKGVHVLIDAMKVLEEQNVRLQARIVGSSSFGTDEETDYVRQLKAASPPTVEFLPYRSGSALADLFREADIFCSPSVWEEPFGLVNVEALASGLPIVSTRGGGVTEILANGGGILVERGSVVELASALRRLAEDPELRTRIGREGLAIFRERFTWSIARAQLQEIEKMVVADPSEVSSMQRPRDRSSGRQDYPLRVAYDAQAFLSPNGGLGKGVQLRNLLGPYSDTFAGFATKGRNYSDRILIQSGLSRYNLWQQISLPYLLGQWRPDVFLAPCNTAPLVIPKRTKLILVLHDMIPMERFRASGLRKNITDKCCRFLIPKAVSRAHIVLTVSSYSRQQIIQRFPSARVEVIPCSISQSWFVGKNVRKLDERGELHSAGHGQRSP